MSDLISRSALEKSIRAYADQVHFRGETELANGILKSLAMVENAVAQDAQPVVHAYWLGAEYDGYADGYPVYHLWECSNCGEESREESAYCPECGAKMDGGTENAAD